MDTSYDASPQGVRQLAEAIGGGTATGTNPLATSTYPFASSSYPLAASAYPMAASALPFSASTTAAADAAAAPFRASLAMLSPMRPEPALVSALGASMAAGAVPTLAGTSFIGTTTEAQLFKAATDQEKVRPLELGHGNHCPEG